MFGARALISSSRMSQPTEAQRIVPGHTKSARWVQLGIGCALSSHSIRTRGQALDRLTLSEALDADRLGDFIAQAEADGVGPISSAAFEEALGELITAPPPEDQTSRSRGGGSKRGK